MWKRSHDDIVLACVRSGCHGTWTADVWLESNPTVGIRSERRFPSRQEACARADMLAGHLFQHRCDASTCGEWLPIEPRLLGDALTHATSAELRQHQTVLVRHATELRGSAHALMRMAATLRQQSAALVARSAIRRAQPREQR
jgi:hypothetical protein